MKNHIVFKFIAIVLCAACLMGAVGGVAGVVVLTSGDLYNKTVDQVIDQRIQQYTTQYADQLALEFAGRELGNCPDSLLSRYDTGWWFDSAFPNYGYTIQDAEGNILATYQENLKEKAETYTIPVTGQYMYLISADPVAKETALTAAPSGDVPAFSIHSELMAQTVMGVASLEVFFSDGSGIRYDPYDREEDPLGYIGNIYYYADTGHAVFESFEGYDYSSDMMTKTVVSISCYDENGRVLFQMSSPNGTGHFSVDNSGRILFTSVTTSQLMAGSVIRAEGLLTDADGETVPENGIAINQVTFTNADGSVLYEAFCHGGDGSFSYNYESGSGSAAGISADNAGFLFYNQAGQLVYHSSLREGELNGFVVYGLNFYNIESGFMFQLDDPDGIGVLSLDNGNLVFTSYAAAATEAEAAAASEEPLSESGYTVETVPGVENHLLITDPEGNSMEVDISGFSSETVPEETGSESIEETAVPETEAPAETEATYETEASYETDTPTEETVPSSASAVPEETSGEAAEETEAPAETAAPEETEAPTVPESATEPIVVETIPETVPEETLPEVTEPVIINGKRLEDYQINKYEYFDSETQQQMVASYVYVTMPEMTVEMYVDRAAMRDLPLYEVLDMVRTYRSYLLPLTAACLLLFAIFAVYLCTAAGRKPKCEEVKAGGLNRLPLDLYLFGGGFAIALIIALGVEAAEMLLRQNILLGCGFTVAATFLACLIFVAFCFAFVAQIKTPNGFWWRNSLCGLCIRGFMKFGVWLENFLSLKGFPALRVWGKKLWNLTVKGVVWTYHLWEKAGTWLIAFLSRVFRWIYAKLNRFMALLPLTWQWLLGGFFLIIVLLIGVDGFKDGSDLSLPVALILTMAVVVYVSHCFGTLSESTKRMSKGDLDTKVDDKLMVGCFQEFAGDLNALADVAVVAAQKQLKSERMKTELITNVSHDIKTPLTSIINYVDLLQKPHTDEEQEQYLEVLDRQSQRLKKLIDDLMDMSKASTGNMAVEITKVDAIESVNQALGEFADKLDRAQLYPVFRHTEDSVPIMADGKLVWRVMSNLLSNAVKYAMPGTRLYIDLAVLEGKVVISMKNISREELNVDADELMERFVRGDDSRNTEGSGLGLNIAKSLMELQKGQLQLLVDGDLFKVTLIFPGA